MTDTTPLLTQIPGPRTLYVGRERRFLKRVRMTMRYWLRRPFYKKEALRLITWLNAHALWRPLFVKDPVRFHSVIYHYCDKRLSPKERVDAIITTLTVLEEKLGPERVKTLVEKGTVELAPLTDTLHLHLNLNAIDYFEGYFSINIQDGTDTRYYDASFGLINASDLLMASIQGPKGEGAQDAVRRLTKALHGVRPMFLMVDAMKLLAQNWGLGLTGIPYAQQTKVRINGSRKVYFNYDDFWEENGGTREANAWRLPLTIERRPLEEIASKKRSMYRKRYEMLDGLEAQMKERLR